jgi:hypothetical protein
MAFLAVASAVPAAAARADDPDPVGRALARAFAGVDPTSLPTGVLIDRAVPLSGLARFDGRPGAPAVDAKTWRQMADELRRAGACGLPHRASLRAAARPHATIPLALLDLGWDRVRDDAIARGALRIEHERIVPGTGPAFESHRTFALGALRDRTAHGARVAFVLARDRVYSDRPPGALRLSADFDDGLGERPIALDEPVAVRYGTVGPRTIRLRATRADGATQHAAATFEVEGVAPPAPDDTLHLTAAESWDGAAGTGSAYVYLAPGHVALSHPIVVIEGFDLDNSLGADELYTQLDQQGLVTTLQADGFDLVVLDFTEATDPIQRNGLLVKTLIEQVQAVIDPEETLALVGASMGALCSRYALLRMESQAIPHRVRTWISFDGPHLGAHIPIGIQYWVKFFAGLSTEAAFLLDRLQTPAARQMLVHHLVDPPSPSATPDPAAAALSADFAALGGWPAQPRRFAIANGSAAQQDQGFTPGTQLIAYDYTSPLVDVRGNVWAVADGSSDTVFHGRTRIFIATTTQTVSIMGALPYDGAPGGWRASMEQMDAVPAPYGDIVALHPNHAFVPSVSAIAFTGAGLFHDIAGDPDLLDQIPFEDVFVPAANEPHVTVSPEGATWLRARLLEGVVSAPGAPPVSRVMLGPAGPNPFEASTRVEFTLPNARAVQLRVVGVDGRTLRTLERGVLGAGLHVRSWDGRDDAGDPVAPGIYVITLAAGPETRAVRVARIR